MWQTCRPMGRLFYWAVVTMLVTASVRGMAMFPQSGPVLTTVQDTVYQADGNPAQGTLIITWPAFVTASGTAVAAGETGVTLGTGGALNVALAANAGASPAGIYYSVVYQLGPGEVRTEYWLVPTSSPATLAQVRTTPGSGTAAPAASIQYVNTALVGKANDNAVVHLSGAETVTGAKTFSAPPSVPTPVGTGDVANKSYVDSQVATVGSGNFLPTAGGAMTGALTLSGNPETLVAEATVLYDGVLTNAPGFCSYALVNSLNLQCSFAYTYAAHISLAEVRSAVQTSPTTYAPYVTQLVGPLAEGAVCEITSSPSLDFYPAYVPPLNELIVASYRGHGTAVAQVQNAASVAALQNGADDGTRGSVRTAKNPGARTASDCENAALAILDDTLLAAWFGTYATWSDFLPGAAADIFPGDAMTVSAPSRGAAFTAIVRAVGIQVADPANDRSFYTIEFANDAAAPLGIEYDAGAKTLSLQSTIPLLEITQVGVYYQVNLTEAQITAVSSTTAQIDAGMTPPSGYGIEVREHDYGWGQENDRNLLGRFSTQTFSLPRLARTQNYFLRLYDNSSPPKYSRYSAALHVDYPL